VKEFLSQRGVEFTERDVTQDEAALAELEALGVLTTPVTLLGKQVIVGFDPVKLEQLWRADAGR
jgi:glutaredoxin